ncbi:restriction endonuclease [Anaerolineales bacterium HSG6]|nr:restriction endonuclease [Anaerolineales bacterium HSG6]
MTANDLTQLTPDEFEQYVSDLYQAMGYKTQRRGKTTEGDQGVDVEARKWRQYVVIQCKRYQGTVSFRDVRDMLGVVTKEQATKGVIITTGKFSKKSIEWAKNQRLELVDGDGITSLLKKHRLGPYKKRSIPMPSIPNPISWIRGDGIPKDINVTEHPKNEVRRSHPNTKRLQEHKVTYRVQLNRRTPNANADLTVENDHLNKRTTVRLTFNCSANNLNQFEDLTTFQSVVEAQVKRWAKFDIVK